jgi:hypothetical protein
VNYYYFDSVVEMMTRVKLSGGDGNVKCMSYYIGVRDR